MYEKRTQRRGNQPSPPQSQQAGGRPAGSLPNSALLSMMEHDAQSERSRQAELLSSRAGVERRLSPDTQAEMEARFGRSLSGLSILESPEVREAGARAYAKGDVIRFAPGQFDQRSEGGREMIAHEIAHVVQQSEGRVRPDSADSPLATASALEHQADAPQEAPLSTGAAPLSAPAFESAPAQMWPWSKKKPAAQTPADRQVNTGGFQFGKRAYLFDSGLRNFKNLLDDYNTGGGTPEQSIALMNAAAQYIDRHSTGEKAKHKGRTAMMEDVLYQLTMKNGTMQRANDNIDRLKGLATGAGKTAEEQAQNVARGKDTLEKLRGLYDPQSGYSKALQMVSAGVMSQQGDTDSYVSGSSSSAKSRHEATGDNSEQTRYTVLGRTNTGENDVLGTNLHEFTHVAAGQSFDNTDMFLTYENGTASADVRAEMMRRRARMKELAALGEKDQQGLSLSDRNLATYTTDRALDYASNWKTDGQYILGEKNKLTRTLLQAAQAGNASIEVPNTETALGAVTKAQLPQMMQQLEAGTRTGGALNNAQTRARILGDYKKIGAFEASFAPDKDAYARAKQADDLSYSLNRTKDYAPGSQARADAEAKLAALKQSFGGTIPKAADVMDQTGPDTMVEYDPVINQMLSQYEHAGGSRDAQYYRILKAEALRSHVRRQAAALRRS